MVKKTATIRHDSEARREAIVQAGLECFLKHGYSKTSLDDIAKAARLSRPLLYLKFKNKEDLFKAVFEYVLADGFKQADKAASSKGTKVERLKRVMDALLLRPWNKVMGHPMSGEFYEECAALDPEVTQRHERAVLKYASTILEDKQLGEVFALATIGIQEGLPNVKILEQRLDILIERFTK